jgi:polyhydroxyalkanoate synthesis regulator phasin
MALYPNVSSEMSHRITKVSDEIGEITRTILHGLEDGETDTSDVELKERLEALKKELAQLIEEREKMHPPSK